LQEPVYPVHRLDRKTAGVLLFARSPDALRRLQTLFAEGGVRKEYLALVRGFLPPEGTIDYPLSREVGPPQEAVTDYQTLFTLELPVPFGKHPTSRFSMAGLFPRTGRYHQLRKHLAHVFHPIIGDRPHGCNKQNRRWKTEWGVSTMLLHAWCLQLEHPFTGDILRVEAPLQDAFREALLTAFGEAKATTVHVLPERSERLVALFSFLPGIKYKTPTAQESRS
jgi:tRNA pseudouridine65 synthase